MKIKSSEEVKIQLDKTLKELKTSFKIQTILIVIVSILSLIVCISSMKLAVDYDVLKQEKEELEQVVQKLNGEEKA